MTTPRGQATALFIAPRKEQAELASLLRSVGFQPVAVTNADAVSDLREPIDLCLVDLRENGESLRVTRVVRGLYPRAMVIGVADPSRPATSADAMRAGVFDVLPRPLTARDLQALIANAREQNALAIAASSSPSRMEAASQGIIGTSSAMRSVLELVQRAAAGRCGILICGERGSGRETIAHAIHAAGPRPGGPFVKVDCAVPTPEEIELQLFGVINKRAGTGAAERRSLERLGKTNRLVDASGGVLFLENLTELPARVQARLARVLRDGEVFVGDGREPVALNLRAIAAADLMLEAAVEEGRLRQDLYERLALIRIDVPPLRQRREDIPVLAGHFLKEICRANNVPLKTLSRAAMTLIAALPLRNNAPELRGLLERLVLLVPHGLIRLEDVLAHTQLEGSVSPTGFDATLRQARARFERDYIAAVLQHQRGRIAEAARVLGIQRTNLYRKMRRLNLTRTKTAGRDV